MNRSNGNKFIILVMCVALFFIISARYGIKTIYDPEVLSSPVIVTNPDDGADGDGTNGGEQPPVEETPDPRDLLPDIRTEPWKFKLVNNNIVLANNFVPELVEIENQYFDERAVDALRAFLKAARDEGFTVYISTAYRPYSTQATMFFGRAYQIEETGISKVESEEMAKEFIAYPGTSEHQLGIAVDLIDSVNTTLDSQALKDTALLVWLRENCAQHGFILRYPEDKKEITGWFEPWHFRYVGVEAAEYMTENNLCLEEFLALY